jgi:hypothetical protein
MIRRGHWVIDDVRLRSWTFKASSKHKTKLLIGAGS